MLLKYISVAGLVPEDIEKNINDTYSDPNRLTQLQVNSEINNLFVSGKIKTEFSDDFRFAYIYVVDRVKEAFIKSGQIDKTDYDAELMAFKILVAATISNISLREFNNMRLDGFIDQYACADIIKQNSIRRNNELLEEDIREENKRKRIEFKKNLPSNVIKGAIALAIALGVLLAGNVVKELFKSAIEKMSKKEPSEKKLTEMKTIEQSLSDLGYYDYDNNEFIRS